MKIKIIKSVFIIPCRYLSPNLTVGSIHNTVDCTKIYEDSVWVQGTEGPVKIFDNEYIEVKS